MANYFTDFTEYATGLIPSDWTARWDATTQYRVQTGGADQILKGLFGSTSNRYLCTWDAVDADADRANVEILTKFKVGQVLAGTTIASVVLRASGTGTSETGYRAGFYGDSLQIAKYGNATNTALVTILRSLIANTDYLLRFRANGTTLQARIWLPADSEPDTWDLDTTDASIPDAGWNGAFGFHFTAAPEFDDFAIATNGETASFAAPSNAPTLSLPLATSITATSAVPQVTLTF